MKARVLGAIAATVLTASTAAAQFSFSTDVGSFSTDGFYIHGYIDLSYFDANDSQTYIRGDLDLGYRPSSVVSSGIALGFGLGIDAVRVNGSGSSFSEAALYPVVVFGAGTSEVSVGIPRSVLNRGYLSEQIAFNSALFDLEVSLLLGSVVTYVHLFGDETPWGLRYDGEFGSTKVGFSYHRVPGFGGTADVLGLAFRHELGTISSFYRMALFGGLEHVSSPGFNDTSYVLGAEGGGEKVRGGLTYGHSGISGDTDAIKAYVDYDFTKDFTVGGTVINLSQSGSDQMIYGLSAEYRFAQGGYVNGSVVDGDVGGGDTVYEFSVGYRF